MDVLICCRPVKILFAVFEILRRFSGRYILKHLFFFFFLVLLTNVALNEVVAQKNLSMHLWTETYLM